jgi:hypothetical protein
MWRRRDDNIDKSNIINTTKIINFINISNNIINSSINIVGSVIDAKGPRVPQWCLLLEATDEHDLL